MYERWAVKHSEGFLVKRSYWPDATVNEIPIRTFRTRELARQAIRQLSGRPGRWQAVKVIVRIEEK